jgi:hypothetical protein
MNVLPISHFTAVPYGGLIIAFHSLALLLILGVYCGEDNTHYKPETPKKA